MQSFCSAFIQLIIPFYAPLWSPFYSQVCSFFFFFFCVFNIRGGICMCILLRSWITLACIFLKTEL